MGLVMGLAVSPVLKAEAPESYDSIAVEPAIAAGDTLPAEAASELPRAVLGEVVVTATKRESDIPLLGLLEPVINVLPAQGKVQLGRERGGIGETVFNPKFTLLWKRDRNLSVFASAVKGFRYAGANQNPTLDPTCCGFVRSTLPRSHRPSRTATGTATTTSCRTPTNIPRSACSGPI